MAKPSDKWPKTSDYRELKLHSDGNKDNTLLSIFNRIMKIWVLKNHTHLADSQIMVLTQRERFVATRWMNPNLNEKSIISMGQRCAPNIILRNLITHWSVNWIGWYKVTIKKLYHAYLLYHN